MQAGSGGDFSAATLPREPVARMLYPQRPVWTRPIVARNVPVLVATTARRQVEAGVFTATTTLTRSFARKPAP
jgi:hypothetical protein